MAYVLKTDFLKDFPKHRTFGQRDGQAKGVCIHNAAATTGVSTQVRKLYIRAAESAGTPIQVREVWIGDANGVPRKSRRG